LIWIALVAAVFVLGGAWFIAKSMPTRIGVLVIGLGAVAIYWTLGRPDMGDLPLDVRIAEIEARERDNPESVTAQDFLVMQEALARNAPNDPEPYRKIGDLYFTNGRMEEALAAYQTALRRDPTFEPAADAISEIEYLKTGEVDAATRAKLPRLGQKAQTDPGSLTSVQVLALIQERVKAAPEDVQAQRMMGDIYASTGHLERAEAAYRAGLELAPNNRDILESWADARFKASQAIDVETSNLYNRAYRLDPMDHRVGYMAGIGLWLQGKKGEAEAIWAAVDKRVPEGGPERQMFAALRQMFGIDPAPPESGANPPNN
jgi:cytochrome c-type biogenesis protein CcmH/NrfG